MMHADFRVFPSVVESAPPGLELSEGDLIDRLVVTDRGIPSLVGELALAEGRSPSRVVNASPDQRDFRVLVKAALLLAMRGREEPVSVGLGFPTATLRLYSDRADGFLDSLDAIEYDQQAFGHASPAQQPVRIAARALLSEIAACDIALREGPLRAAGNFFILSLGYGTCEAALAGPSGIVQRTAVSLPGIRYAIDRAMHDVQRMYNVGLRTEHQFDAHFRTGRITVGRERVSITDARKRALEAYMQNVVAPALQNTWSAEDYDRADTLYITGGGSMYPVMLDLIRNEFSSALTVNTVPDPISLAALGYALRAAKQAPDGALAVGIDIGNANTCVCTLEP
jgi:hypothetical protein